MSPLQIYLQNPRIQKALRTKPGEEGFSLVELVVVIAVLAILSAIAIPAFNGVQTNAKAAAVKNGMTNGIKECMVLDARGVTNKDWDQARAFLGEYAGYNLEKWGKNNCFGVTANSEEDALPRLRMRIDPANGEVTKECRPSNNEYCW